MCHCFLILSQNARQSLTALVIITHLSYNKLILLEFINCVGLIDNDFFVNVYFIFIHYSFNSKN